MYQWHVRKHAQFRRKEAVARASGICARSCWVITVKKHITFILLLAFMVLSACPAAASSFSDMTLAQYEHAVTELEALHIIKGYEDGTFRPDVELTRAEFCSLIINVMGLDGVAADSAVVEFADVTPEHWAFSCVKLAYDMGIINGYGDGYFGPDDKVTYVQTLKMLLNTMGYAPMAEDSGGYPTGYIMVGSSRISGGVKKAADAFITRGEAAQLIYNALDVNIVEEDYNIAGGYKINYDKTLLTELMDRRGLEKMEGMVTGDSHTRLTHDTGVAEGWLEIDGTAYYLDGRSSYGLLGRSVTYYVQERTGTGNEPALYGIWANTRKNDELKISPKDITEITANEIVYFEEPDSTWTTRARLADTPITIFNGKYMTGGSENWKVQNGQLTLLDNNSDGVYEIVFVDSYVTYMVDSVDTEKKQINLRVFSDKGESRYRGKTCIEYGFSDVTVTVSDMDGNELAATDLKPYDIIAVYAGIDETHISIVRAEGVIEGTVSEVTDDELVINNVRYEFAVNNAGENLLTVSAGEQGRFWLDIDGRVTAKNVVSGSDYSKTVETIDDEVICSYIVDTAVQEGIDKVVSLKVLSNLRSKQREERIFTLKDKLRVDGVQMSAAEALEAIKAAGDGSANIPIRYDINSRNEIDEIETFALAAPADYRKYSKSTNSFDGLYFMTTESIVYFVDNANYEKVYGNTEVSLGDGLPYYIKVFDPADMEFAAENRIFVVYVNMATAKAPETDPDKPLLVTSLAAFSDAKGDDRIQVSGMIDGEEVTYTLVDKAEEKLDRIGRGSLLRVTKNSAGEISDFRVMANLPLNSEQRIGIGGNNEQTYGRALSIKSNSRYTSIILEVGYEKNGEQKSVAYDIASCPVYLFYDARSIKVGTPNDITTAEYGGENASTVFVSVVNFKPVAVVVMR